MSATPLLLSKASKLTASPPPKRAKPKRSKAARMFGTISDCSALWARRSNAPSPTAASIVSDYQCDTATPGMKQCAACACVQVLRKKKCLRCGSKLTERSEPRAPTATSSSASVWRVKSVLARRGDAERGVEWLVRWHAKPAKCDEWLSGSALRECDLLIQEFYRFAWCVEAIEARRGKRALNSSLYVVKWRFDEQRTLEPLAHLSAPAVLALVDAFNADPDARVLPTRVLANYYDGAARDKPPPKRNVDKAKLAALFVEQGLAQLPAALTARQVDKCREAVELRFERCLRTLQALDKLDELKAVGYTTFKLRHAGRYDMVLPEFQAGGSKAFRFLTGERVPWLGAVRAILGEKCRLVHNGVMHSMPRSAVQPWHSDGPHLNADFERRHLPPHAVNVFVPLCDLTLANGPTEFVPGSHRNWHCVEPPLVVTARRGDALLFDYRIKHRGLGNASNAARPLLYFTYARDGWTDSANFSQSRYKVFPEFIERKSREQRAKERQEKRTATIEKQQLQRIAAALGANEND